MELASSPDLPDLDALLDDPTCTAEALTLPLNVPDSLLPDPDYGWQYGQPSYLPGSYMAADLDCFSPGHSVYRAPQGPNNHIAPESAGVLLSYLDLRVPSVDYALVKPDLALHCALLMHFAEV